MFLPKTEAGKAKTKTKEISFTLLLLTTINNCVLGIDLNKVIGVWHMALLHRGKNGHYPLSISHYPLSNQSRLKQDFQI